MAKTISTILYNDNIEGTKLVSMDNCVCQLFDICRDDDQFCTYIRELNRPALYILLNRKLAKAYIGETADFSKRIINHLSKKPFWQEVLVFTATNNSLTKTEVLYLETLAYKYAEEAGNFDLSANTQIPTTPALTSIVEIRTKGFFKDVQFLTKFIGCNIFEKTHKRIEVIKDAPLILPIKVDTLSANLMGRCFLSLEGQGNYTKRAFVHAVVKKIIETFPSVTYAQLKATFPREFLGYWAKWELLEDDLEFAKQLSEGKRRYSCKDEQILKSGDGVRFAVCTEWDSNNLIPILGIVKALGWNYEIVNK